MIPLILTHHPTSMSVRRIRGSWWIDVWYRGVRHRRKSPIDTLTAARRYERQFVEKLERARMLDLRDPFDLDPGVRFNAYVKANMGPSTQISYESVLRRALLPFFGRTALEDITALSIEAFKLEQLEKGVSRKTVNIALAVISRSLRSALEWAIIATMPQVRLLVTETPRFRYLTAALSADPVVVFGTDKAERAIGLAAAKALLAKWRKLPLAIEEADKVREVRTASWGFAIADVNISKPGGSPYRMSGFFVAVPSPNGAWSVVAASYGAL